MSSNEPKSENGWLEWKNHVLGELERLNTSLEHYRENQQKILIELAKQKVYIGMVSSSAAFLASIVVTVVFKYFL